MPTYLYACAFCSTAWDVVKSMSAIDRIEECPACGRDNDSKARQVTRTYFYGAKVEDATWDPAFGKVIKSARHRKDEARARGLTEIGNEKPETIEKHFERQREETREKRWAEADRDKVYE